MEEKEYFEDRKYEKEDFTISGLPIGEYDNCHFYHCDFSNTNLSGCHFSECSFTGCNLGMAKMQNTSLRDVRFVECKLLGIQFNECDDFLFAVSFDHCMLKLASFYGMSLKKMKCTHSNFAEVDFSEAEREVNFINCDFTSAIFHHTNLEKADFRSSVNYAIDPVSNKIKKAKFSLLEVRGLLYKFDVIVE